MRAAGEAMQAPIITAARPGRPVGTSWTWADGSLAKNARRSPPQPHPNQHHSDHRSLHEESASSGRNPLRSSAMSPISQTPRLWPSP